MRGIWENQALHEQALHLHELQRNGKNESEHSILRNGGEKLMASKKKVAKKTGKGKEKY